MRTYGFAGLTVASELALPGLAAAAAGPAAPDVTVRIGRLPLSLDDPLAAGPQWELSRGGLIVAAPGLGRFLLTAGRELTVEIEPGREAEDVAALVAETLLAILVQQSGRFVLRASAVAIDGGAALFCGPSGAGKSTLAAALVQAGYRPLGDDLCAVDLSTGTPLLLGDGCALRLWEEAADALGLAVGEAVRPGLRKYVASACAAPPPSPLPMVAVYRLVDAFGGCSVERLQGGAAVRALRDSAVRPQLGSAMGVADTIFAGAVAVAGSAAVANLRRPRDLSRLPGAVEALEADWRGLERLGAGG